MKTFTVYILECEDGSYYTGVTSDLPGRMVKHNTGYYPNSYTSSRRPVVLKWAQEFSNPYLAFNREKQLKNWSYAKKKALIEGEISKLKSIAKKKF